MYKLLVTAKAKREIKALTTPHRQALVKSLQELRDDPHLGKPLVRELTGLYSYRVGVYRIIYLIREEDSLIIVLTAGHRSTVYG
jgi:mRNA interferase RelE/StbE